MRSKRHPGATQSAVRGAEAALAHTHESGECEEASPASLADALHGPCRAPIGHDHHGLARFDASAIPSARPRRVAVATTRDEVLRAVVTSVPVQMIGEKSPSDRPHAGHPIHGCTTPMTSMRTGTDPVIQDQPSDGNQTRWWRKRMANRLPHTMVFDRPQPGSAESVVTGPRTEAIRTVRPSWLKRDATLFAGGHPRIIAYY